MKIKRFKPLLFIGILFFSIVISFSIAYYFNVVSFNSSTVNKKLNFNCTQGVYNDFGYVNLVCTSASDTLVPVLFRFRYDEYWEASPELNCSSGGEAEDVYGSGHDWQDNNDVNQGEAPTDPLDLVAYNLNLKQSLSTISNFEDGEETVINYWNTYFENNFVYGNDGWYYYKYLVAPGDNIYILDSVVSSLETSSKFNMNFIYEVLEDDSDVVNELWNVTYTIDNESSEYFVSVDWNFN